ncbi:MAG: hypothetical protein Q8P41_13155 [Pseudomonadota bacterium]|nr:hypothetical protein [Pseudomonadota bacterium]
MRFLCSAFLLALLLPACGRGVREDDTDGADADADTDSDSDSDSDADTDTDTDTDADTDTDTDTDTDCDTSGLAGYTPVASDVVQIRPSLTARDGEVIDDTLQGTEKLHYTMRRTDGGYDREELFVWFGGSGSEPTNYDLLLNMAVSVGYTAVALAYDNETSVGELCGQAKGECSNENPECEGEVRYEMLYGVDTSPCFEMTPANSIENRITRLVQAAHAQAPDGGFDRYLGTDGESLDWTHIAVGGWSQGGGHAAAISRDFLVARALFTSKASDSAVCHVLYADDPTVCDTDGDGLYGLDYNPDEVYVPSPWTYDPRVTPGSRLFGVYHQREEAAYYTDEVFAAYGMAGADAPLNIDDLVYPDAFADTYDCTHTFVSNATPAYDANAYHRAMGPDIYLSLGEDGLPLLGGPIVYALSLPVE